MLKSNLARFHLEHLGNGNGVVKDGSFHPMMFLEASQSWRVMQKREHMEHSSNSSVLKRVHLRVAAVQGELFPAQLCFLFWPYLGWHEPFSSLNGIRSSLVLVWARLLNIVCSCLFGQTQGSTKSHFTVYIEHFEQMTHDSNRNPSTMTLFQAGTEDWANHCELLIVNSG